MYLRGGNCSILDNFPLSDIDRDLATSVRHFQGVENGTLGSGLHAACHRFWVLCFYARYVPPSACLVERRA